MGDRTQLYVGGKWVEPAGPDTITVVNAATEEPLASVPAGSREDVDRAVAAARDAFDGWSATSLEDRLACMERLHAGLVDRIEDVGRLIAEEVGMPLASATVIQGGVPAAIVKSFIDLARVFPWEEPAGASTIVREPVGVAAAITPWNYPLFQAACKAGAALTAGCTMVLKPSEIAPRASFALADAVHEAGFPPGVFNLVSGHGPVAGEALVAHPGVDMVSFTGSTATGRRIAALAAQELKRVTLELGGKSASLILDDADLEEAVDATVRQTFLNSGQTCMAWSRLIVPRPYHDEAARIARKVAEQLVVGDPLAEGTDIGPVASSQHRDKVRRYIRLGMEEGATLVTGGPEPPDGFDRGYYVRPTVFADVTNDMSIAIEEIFGPVVVIIPAEDDDDAVRIANESAYGLHGAVFSRDKARAERVARRLRTGQVDVCGVGGFNVAAPFGGYKQSGRGRELGRFGLEEYLEVKALALP